MAQFYNISNINDNNTENGVNFVDAIRSNANSVSHQRMACAETFKLLSKQIKSPQAKAKLVQLGLDDCTLTALRNFPDDEKVQEFGVLAINALLFSPDAATAMANKGAHNLVLDVLDVSDQQLKVHLLCLSTLSKFISLQPSTKAAIFEAGVMQRTMDAAKVHRREPQFAGLYLQLVGRFFVTSDAASRKVAEAAGVLPFVVSLMNSYHDNEKVLNDIITTLVVLSSDELNSQELAEHVPSKVLEAMKKYPNVLPIQQSGCSYVARFASRDANLKNETVITDMVQSKVIPTLLLVATNHDGAKTHNLVLSALANLGNSAYVRVHMEANKSVFSVIQRLMVVHKDDSRSQYLALVAMCNFATESEPNQEVLVYIGMHVETASVLLRFPEDRQIQYTGLLCLSTFTSKATVKLDDLASALRNVTTRFPDDEKMQQIYLNVIRNLSSDIGNAHQMQQDGTLDTVLAQMAQFPSNPLVAESGCGTIAYLAEFSMGDQIQSRGDDLLKHAFECLETHPKNKLVQKHAILAIAELCKILANHNYLLDGDRYLKVVELIEWHQHDEDIMGAGCAFVYLLSNMSTKVQKNMAKHGMKELVKEAQKEHSGNQSVKKYGDLVSQLL